MKKVIYANTQLEYQGIGTIEKDVQKVPRRKCSVLCIIDSNIILIFWREK